MGEFLIYFILGMGVTLIFIYYKPLTLFKQNPPRRGNGKPFSWSGPHHEGFNLLPDSDYFHEQSKKEKQPVCDLCFDLGVVRVSGVIEGVKVISHLPCPKCKDRRAGKIA